LERVGDNGQGVGPRLSCRHELAMLAPLHRLNGRAVKKQASSARLFLLFPIWEHCYKACMRLVARNVLLAYARTHPETAVPLERWYRLVKAANWTSMDDIRRASPKAKVLNRDRARFEVAGGNDRLIASFDFRRQIVFVKFIGTHAEYDAIDALTVARF
jgi:mRNA interferase HigB